MRFITSEGGILILGRATRLSRMTPTTCSEKDSYSSTCPVSAVGLIPAAHCKGCRGQLLGQTGRRRSSEVCPLTVDGPFQGPLMGCATHPWIVNGDHWDAWVACSSQRTFFFWSVMIVLSQAGTITRPYSARIQYRSCAAGS